MKRRGKKKAIIAIAQMMLTSIFAMFQTGETFCPSDLQKYNMPDELQKKRSFSAAKEAVKLFVSLGLIADGIISLESLTPAGYHLPQRICVNEAYLLCASLGFGPTRLVNDVSH